MTMMRPRLHWSAYLAALALGVVIGLTVALDAHARVKPIPPSAGQVQGAGADVHGELGDGVKASHQTTPVAAKLPCAVKEASASYYQSFFLCLNGDEYAVGGDQLGELGNGTRSQHPVLKAVRILTGVSQISRGSALKGGRVYEHGLNAFATQGNGRHGYGTGSLVPVPVPGLSGVTQISAGGASRFAVKADGSLWSWGEDRFSQLGGPKAKRQLTRDSPVKVASGVSAVSVGGVASQGGHTLILWPSGTVSCFGDHRHGECINPGLHGIVEVAAGFGFSLARNAFGEVLIWGTLAGHLYSTPTPIFSSLVPASAIAAGQTYALAVVGATVEGIGSSKYGALGVVGLTGIVGVSASEFHSEVWR